MVRNSRFIFVVKLGVLSIWEMRKEEKNIMNDNIPKWHLSQLVKSVQKKTFCEFVTNMLTRLTSVVWCYTFLLLFFSSIFMVSVCGTVF